MHRLGTALTLGILALGSLAAPAHAADLVVAHALRAADIGADADPVVDIEITGPSGEHCLPSTEFGDHAKIEVLDGLVPGTYIVEALQPSSDPACQGNLLLSEQITISALDEPLLLVHRDANGFITAGKFSISGDIPPNILQWIDNIEQEISGGGERILLQCQLEEQNGDLSAFCKCFLDDPTATCYLALCQAPICQLFEGVSSAEPTQHVAPRRLQFLDHPRGMPLLPGRGSMPIVLRQGNVVTIHLAGEEPGDVDTIELDLSGEVDDPASVAEQLEEEAAEALEEAAENIGG